MKHPGCYIGALTVLLLTVICAHLGGAGFFFAPLFMFVIAPIGERLLGQSHWPSDAELKALTPAQERLFGIMPVLTGISMLALIGWALWAVTCWSLEGWQFLALSFSVGILSGLVGIVVAHEMMHRQEALPGALAWALMASVLYPHYTVEHVLGHHHHYATRDDPATGRRGESIYAFLPRSLVFSLISAFRLRPRQVGAAWLLVLAALWAIAALLGVAALHFMLIQGVTAFVLLEVVNYLEHYGLERRRLADGNFAPAGVGHSWDTHRLATNLTTFNLGRHTDHHQFSRRPYYRLRRIGDAPELPHGYATMLLIALVPPLWFRMMNPRIAEWEARQAGQAEGSFSKRNG